MNAQDILKTLNALEQSLQNVESARQQVTNTVNAYEGAKSQLHALVTEFSSVSTELKNVYAAINENVSSIDNTLEEKIGEVFTDISCKTQGLEDTIKNIQLVFEATCKESAQSIKDSVGGSLLKLNDGVQVVVEKFNEKAASGIESISATLEAFKFAVQQIQEDFKNAISGEFTDFKATQESVVSEFNSSVSKHMASLKLLENELQSIIDKYEEKNNSLITKINNVSDLVKNESKAIVEVVQGKLSLSVGELKGSIDEASLFIGKNQNETVANTEKRLIEELESLKLDLAKSKKFAMVCFVVIIVLLILHFIFMAN